MSDGQHVFYVDSQGHVNQLYYSAAANHWYPQDLTQWYGGPAASPASGISGFSIADGQHVYYLSSSGRPQQFYYIPSANRWINQDLGAGAPQP